MNKRKKIISQSGVSAAATGVQTKWLNSPLTPAVILVLILLPFVDKAFHIDDPLFIWSAQQIQKHPLDFYGFNVNWYGSEMPMYEVAKNPPLASYYIAGIGSFFGYGEIPLHIGFILPAIAVAVGTFYLARIFCSNALAAALIAILNPVFLVSATTLMCDTMMLAFWVWALFFWIRGIETQEHKFLLLAAIFTIFCAMTKYFGIAIIPLIAIYAISYKRRFGRWFFYWLLPIIALVLYQWWTFSLYGRGLLSDASSYAAQSPVSGSLPLLHKIIISLAFTGGCLVPVLFYSHLLWAKKTLLARIVTTVVIICLLYFFPAFGDTAVQGRESFRGNLTVTIGLMVIAGVSLVGLTLDELRKGRDRKAVLIFLWIIGTFVFAGFINWAINARSLLPMTPAVGILVASRLERGRISILANYLRCLLPLVPAGVIAIAVVWADYSQADSARRTVEMIHKEAVFIPDNTWFEGHWGFQYYMEKTGYMPLNFKSLKIPVGDFLIIPQNNTNILLPPANIVTVEKNIEVISCPWLASMNIICGAGFYSDSCGPVPYVFGGIPPENYYVMKIKSVWVK